MIWAKATTHGMKTQEGNLCKPASGACQGRHSTPNSGQFNKAQEKGAMCPECKWWRSWFSRPVPWKFTPVGHWTVKLHYQMLSFFSNESPWGEEAPVWKVEVFFQPDLTVLKVTSPWFTMHLLTTIHTHTHTHTLSLSLSLSFSSHSYGIDSSLDSIKHLTKLLSLRQRVALQSQSRHNANNRLWNEGPN